MSVLMRSYLMATHGREIPVLNELSIIDYAKGLTYTARKDAAKSPGRARYQSTRTLDMGVVLLMRSR